uniref:Uncharacterized protein n=1 Tax=Lotharella globosa TaxID=91324 RepID=A0A7S4DXN9_9EUKA|mmetsp:Transcript_5525/g.10009  ORF Transcript_5525/g.10009 Transcript_5525/m.10009 type:complete len:490 (-) Transcript_5525:155-1624(-)|eukprot:CAMPEP_0167809960 /NCGR_PEP_ID=MMETSP0111_2-20121227/24103_1 /TAXON_ID=91324 /ORGANISM="Lotharella globosa, Strain CCCM811" /LENGTH=489 /DNA_ID=CAMNT_0007708441 /DNA_START=47 /DNA_END=1516 /DNA_ORIENTATION=+
MLAGGLYLSNILFSDILQPHSMHAVIGPEMDEILPSPSSELPDDLTRMSDTSPAASGLEGTASVGNGPKPTPPPNVPPTPPPAPQVWKPECERWTAFRSDIYKPKEMAPSILSRPEPCTGNCVAVCICGSLRTFFQPKVSNSIAGTLINGFNPSGRTDVFMVVSEEHSAKGGVFVVPQKDQCELYSKMNMVTVDYMQQHDASKTARCKQLIEETENKHKKKYNWIMRPRPDSYWKQMNLKADSAKKAVYYRHNQFTLLPREHFHNFIWPFRGTPEIEVDVNERPKPMFEFYLWRTSRVLGLKFRYYESTCMYMVPTICAPCSHGNRDHVGPAFKLIQEAKSSRDPKHVRRLRDCLHGLFSVACHQLKAHFKAIDPPPTSTRIDVKAILQTAGDLAEGGVTSPGPLDSLGGMLDQAQGGLRGELMIPDDNEGGWMPSLQKACAGECNASYNYTKGPWRWGCLPESMKTSLAMSWHPPGFAALDAGEMGEC